MVHLSLELRASGNAKFVLIGDGGVVETEAGRKWAVAWKDVTQSIAPSPEWRRYQVSTRIAPLHGYDLRRGVTVYLLFATSSSAVFLRHIRLVVTEAN